MTTRAGSGRPPERKTSSPTAEFRCCVQLRILGAVSAPRRPCWSTGHPAHPDRLGLTHRLTKRLGTDAQLPDHIGDRAALSSRFCRRNSASSLRSSLVRPSFLPSSMSACAIHLRSPNSEVSGDLRDRFLPQPSQLNPPDGGTPDSSAPAYGLLSDDHGRLTVGVRQPGATSFRDQRIAR